MPSQNLLASTTSWYLLQVPSIKSAQYLRSLMDMGQLPKAPFRNAS
jgi:hypothetical protein